MSGRSWPGLRGSRSAGSRLEAGTVISRPFLGWKPQVRSNEFRYYFPVKIGPAFRRGGQLLLVAIMKPTAFPTEVTVRLRLYKQQAKK